MTGLPDAERI